MTQQASLPKSHTVKLWIRGKVYDDTPDQVFISTSVWEPGKNDDYFVIKTVEVEVDLSDVTFDPTTRQVQQLQEQIKAIRGEAENECTKIQGQINRLLQLEYVEASR